jgi:hypothetical protein
MWQVRRLSVDLIGDTPMLSRLKADAVLTAVCAP